MMMMMMMWGISWTNKQTHMYVVGFPLTCKNNYNLLEAREARDEIIL